MQTWPHARPRANYSSCESDRSLRDPKLTERAKGLRSETRSLFERSGLQRGRYSRAATHAGSRTCERGSRATEAPSGWRNTRRHRLHHTSPKRTQRGFGTPLGAGSTAGSLECTSTSEGEVGAMARERKGTLLWRAKGGCALVALFGASMLANCGTTIGECDIMCPPGMRVDVQDPGCTCIPTGDAGAADGGGE